MPLAFLRAWSRVRRGESLPFWGVARSVAPAGSVRWDATPPTPLTTDELRDILDRMGRATAQRYPLLPPGWTMTECGALPPGWTVVNGRPVRPP